MEIENYISLGGTKILLALFASLRKNTSLAKISGRLKMLLKMCERH